MKYLNFLLIGLITALSSLTLNAQSRFSIQVGIGGMYYNGDLRATSLPDLRTSHLAYGGGINYQITNSIFVSYRYTSGSISGSDEYQPESSGRRARGLSFESPVRDHSIRLGAYLKDLDRSQRLSLIGFAGIGLTRSTPTGNIDGMPNGRLITIPVGLSLEYRINSTFAIYAESTFHETFTDRLDGISESANPALGDSYVDVLVGIKIFFPKKGSGRGYKNLPKGFAPRPNGGGCPAYQ